MRNKVRRILREGLINIKKPRKGKLKRNIKIKINKGERSIDNKNFLNNKEEKNAGIKKKLKEKNILKRRSGFLLSMEV